MKATIAPAAARGSLEPRASSPLPESARLFCQLLTQPPLSKMSKKSGGHQPRSKLLTFWREWARRDCPFDQIDQNL